MTLFTSLYTGVGGMNAQSQATGTISNNIANMTTVGFKRSETTFRDLVVNNTRPAHFANGGVLPSQVNRINQQGALQQTQGATEMGINGQGFFVVKTADDSSLPYLYTRNGSFSPDVNGVLRNAAGFMVYGWPVDEQGNVSSGTTLDSLVPVDVNELDSQSRATSAATLAVNLDAGSSVVNPQLLTGTLPVSSQSTWDTILQTTVDNSSAASFSRSLTVYDDQGNPRDLSFEFRHITGPMAQTTSGASSLDFSTKLTDPSVFNLAAGDTFTVTAGGSPVQSFTIANDSTVGDLINSINTGGTAVDAMLDENGRIILRAADLNANLTIGGTAATGPNTLAFPGTNFAPLADPTVAGAANPDQADYPSFSNTATPNTNGWWEMRVLKEADPSLTTADGLYQQPVEISKGLINFDGTGQFNATPDANGNIALTVNPGTFDANSGASLGDITIDMSGFTQYAGGYNVLTADQNGAEAGTLNRLNITTEGDVIAHFTNNDQFQIFKIPLAQFVNPDGLALKDGTVFSQTQDSGDLTLKAAGSGGTGTIQASTLEQSNVDLGDEFAKMIVSQRAFQANSKVVSTVDEMTQQLRQLKT